MKANSPLPPCCSPARRQNLERVVPRCLLPGREDGLQDGLIGKLPVRYHDQPTARLQRLRRRADDARTDRGVGRAPPVKWWIHHNDVITPLDGLGQEVVPEEAFFWHVASHVGPGRFQGL